MSFFPASAAEVDDDPLDGSVEVDSGCAGEASGGDVVGAWRPHHSAARGGSFFRTGSLASAAANPRCRRHTSAAGVRAQRTGAAAPFPPFESAHPFPMGTWAPAGPHARARSETHKTSNIYSHGPRGRGCHPYLRPAASAASWSYLLRSGEN